MSLTYISAIAQFLIALNILTPAEAQIVSDGISAILALAALAVTLFGRWRAGGVNPFGFRE